MCQGGLLRGGGAVLQGTSPVVRDRRGCLPRALPSPAVLFLIGAVAVSGLPPLNGFVGEWFTYQAFLAGFRSTASLTKLVFPVAGALLALTGALAATAFVKAFGISFLALPRSSEVEHAPESPWTMLAGMGIPAVSCLILGVGASWLLPALDSVTGQLFGGRQAARLVTLNGF